MRAYGLLRRSGFERENRRVTAKEEQTRQIITTLSKNKTQALCSGRDSNCVHRPAPTLTPPMQPQDPLAHRKRITSASYWTAQTQADLGDVTVSETGDRLADASARRFETRATGPTAAARGMVTIMDEGGKKKKKRKNKRTGDGLKDKSEDRADCNVNFSRFS